jgi:RimJ/RimL family protein N-acetyltransferase
VIAAARQGRGYAKEAAAAMVAWLEQQSVRGFVAHIYPDHAASNRVARHLGLRPTNVMEDGEVRWVR